MYSIRPTWDKIENYQEAKERYESIDPIKFKKQDNTDHYGTDCRPLGRRNAPWIRIEKGVAWVESKDNQTQTEGTGFSSPATETPQTYFDCILYRTAMVRYYEDGRIVVAPKGIEKHNHTVSSAKFLDRTLPHAYSCWIEAGLMVVRGMKKAVRAEDKKYEKVEKSGYVTVDWVAYYADVRENQSRGIVPYNGESLELDVGVRGFKNAKPAYYVTLNRNVTKLHRERIKETIDQVYALASIIDGVEVNGLEWGEAERQAAGNDPWSVERVLYWMQCNFSGGTWDTEYGKYRRVFNVPSRKAFNDKFFPAYYFTVEHSRNPQTDESLFELKAFEEGEYLRASRKWYSLHKGDPRRETHPNIL